MVFSSVDFFIFFIIVVSLYFVLPQRFRWVLLLGSSYYFYMCWKAEYAVLIFTSTLISYVCAILTNKADSRFNRKLLLTISVAANLGILFVFKYFNFFSESLAAVLSRFSISLDLPVLNLLLPVGISFYTFQTLSYSIDVYRGRLKPEKHFGIFALYVSFFPQLVAGPIERAANLLPQFYKKTEFEYERVRSGAQLIVWGLFKKIVIADNLAVYVDSVYNNVEHHSGFSCLVATYFFAFQIYCDFSGYSDIAIGAAKILGFDLMKNFNRPYFATTVTDFWHRWHISLSTWLRDYLYIPIGGNRKGRLRTYVNLMITMLLGGIWHGANWTFVIWGGLHGLFLLTSKLTVDYRNSFLVFLKVPDKIVSAVRMLITFHLVCIAWVFFRANNISDAFQVFGKIFSEFGKLFVHDMTMAHGLAGILILLLAQIFYSKGLEEQINRGPSYIRWSIYYFIVFTILILGANKGSHFIYFQF